MRSAFAFDFRKAGIGFDLVDILLRSEAAPLNYQQQTKGKHGNGTGQGGELNGIEFHIQEPDGSITGDGTDLRTNKKTKETIF